MIEGIVANFQLSIPPTRSRTNTMLVRNYLPRSLHDGPPTSRSSGRDDPVPVIAVAQASACVPALQVSPVSINERQERNRTCSDPAPEAQQKLAHPRDGKDLARTPSAVGATEPLPASPILRFVILSEPRYLLKIRPSKSTVPNWNDIFLISNILLMLSTVNYT